jgi:hypothetical protein
MDPEEKSQHMTEPANALIEVARKFINYLPDDVTNPIKAKQCSPALKTEKYSTPPWTNETLTRAKLVQLLNHAGLQKSSTKLRSRH